MLLTLSLHLLCPLPVPTIVPARLAPAPVVVTDSIIKAARAALERGQGWRATWMLAPLLVDSSNRKPETVILAAQAAASWGGWREVDNLLAREAWVNSAFAGEGQALLARAALERAANEEAVVRSRQAVASAGTPASRGARLVVLARALDRLDSLAAAASAYAAAADALPPIADWLWYRAAIVTPATAERAARFARISHPVAREQLPNGRADGWLRAGDTSRAALAYDSAGSWSAAYRTRATVSKRSLADSAAFRAELIRVLESRSGTTAGRAAFATLDEFFFPLAPAVELAGARNAPSAARAVRAFERAFSAGLGSDRDYHEYGRQLFTLGRYADAGKAFARVTSPATLAASAAYQRGRALVRGGDVTAGREALRTLLRQHASDDDAASSALYLLGDLATDEGRDEAARDAFSAVAARYPSARLAPAAAFRAATITLTSGRPQAAAGEFDKLVERFGTSTEANAARYWSGVAWNRAGDSARATERWTALAARDRTGYYGALASRRLARQPWTPAPAPDHFVPVPEVDSALARVAQLTALGLDREARWELEAISSRSDSSAERLLAAANALRTHKQASRGIRLTWKALERGASSDARTYRLLYPLVFEAALIDEARQSGVNPWFAAALIRQESMFTPGATSGAGARGLMQVMPAVGRDLARARRFPVWDAVLLYEPDVNLQLGMSHLGDLLRRYGDPVRTLAAYNAGGTRVARWDKKEGADDLEVFTERIPYTETRDYVRIVQRNAMYYQQLYDWK